MRSLTEDNLAEAAVESLLSKVRPRVPLIRLAVRAPADAAERVLAALLELAPRASSRWNGEGTVEFGVYGAPGELPELLEGEAEVGGVRVTVSGEEVPDDWAERWKRFHAPVLVGRPAVGPSAVGAARASGRHRPRDRSRPGFRHRFAPNHADVPRAAAALAALGRAAPSAISAAGRACSRSPPRGSASGRHGTGLRPRRRLRDPRQRPCQWRACSTTSRS